MGYRYFSCWMCRGIFINEEKGMNRLLIFLLLPVMAGAMTADKDGFIGVVENPPRNSWTKERAYLICQVGYEYVAITNTRGLKQIAKTLKY